MFITWLENITFEHETGKGALNAHLEMVKQQRGLLLKVTRHLRELSKGPDYKLAVELLTSIPGIGMLTALSLLTELETIERFENFDRLCSYIGLVPSTNSSGDNELDTGITPRRNSRLRAALVESAWIAIRNDPALLVVYQKLCGRMPGNRAIIRIAKKLLSRIVYVLRSKQKYERGVVR
jgi:transposase